MNVVPELSYLSRIQKFLFLKVYPLASPSESAAAGLRPSAVLTIFLAPLPIFAAALVMIVTPELRGPAREWGRENGPIELATFAAFTLGALWSLWLACSVWRLSGNLLAGLFYLLFGLGLFILAMEEIAWGQWFVGFETPRFWRDVNLQGEMTLHNVELFQGKTEALRLIFGLGGLLGVALFSSPLRLFRAITPSPVLLLWFLAIALFAAGELLSDFVAVPEALHRGFRNKFFSEYQELAISAAALLFLWLNARRLRDPREAGA